jgi:SAM-dependent methyltransferase
MTELPDEAAACLACGGRLATVLDGVFDTRFGIDAAFRIARCGACGLEQTLPRPEAAALGAYYAAHYNFGGESGTTYTGLRARFLESGIYRLWLALDGDMSFHTRPGRGRLLDIGCNEGRGLALYARNGFAAVEGLETNPAAAAAARARGFAVHGGALAEFHPNQPYDVAVLSNVLEHALDPADMLRQVRRILKPGGEVWISCPNATSWQRRLFGRLWINWHVPFHIVHFTDATLSRALDDGGFATAERSQVTPALWVAHSTLAALSARRGRPTTALRRPVPVMLLMALARGLLFPLLWLGNRVGTGDCLLRIARRAG